jgi:GNAT superfamily N-acetyltransferase
MSAPSNSRLTEGYGSSDLALSRRLEDAEGTACAQFAGARSVLFHEPDAAWIEHEGTVAVFNGVDSPITQSFGLGLFADLTPESLDVIERFFLDHGAQPVHEVSPFAEVATLDLLCKRNYRPIELSNVLYRPVERPQASPIGPIAVRIADEEEREIWTEINAKGWAHDHPELMDFLRHAGKVSFTRADTIPFLAKWEGTPGAAGALCLHKGVALFAGSATLPELRRRGLHTALLHERMRYAIEQGCDLAMMVAEVGSRSQRNAEREGFRIAYTRTKWRLCS